MIERIVFVLLTALSVGYFCKILLERLRPMREAQPRLRFDRLGERFYRTLAEVFFQTRVLADRPWVGLCHALVMWGFFAFAWVSAEHLWWGLRGLEYAEPLEGWYSGFAAAWAALVLIGMGFLTFRRFVLRPPSLGPLSASSGVVAALIAGLMITYLAGWRGLPPDTFAWRLNWWLHTLCFLGMFFAIPNSKHLHLLLAPVAIFFRSGATTSPMRALREEDEDDFGMLRFTDVSQKDILDVNACVECGRCTDVCPANIVGGSLDPKHVILQMQRGLLAHGDRVAGADAEVDAGSAWVRERDLYQCLSCGACEQACPVGIEHVGAKILDLRRGLVSEGRTHNDKLTDLFNVMERAPHTPFGVPHDVRRKFIESEEFPVFDGSQQLLFWLGCGTSYDPHGQDVARAMKRILNTNGVSWGVLARETCCGEPARRTGNEYLYMECSEKIIAALQENKPAALLTCDPHCARMFDVDYRQNAEYNRLNIQVQHHTEFIAHRLTGLQLSPSGGKITFHDPCYLARGRGVVEEPRSILTGCGMEIAEMRRSREKTFCCGAGGGQLFLTEDKPESGLQRINHKRFEEAAATGAETIAVACPYCPIMLKDAAQHTGREDVRILDVAEIVAERLV